MSIFYEDTRALADSLLSEFGRDITFIRYDKAAAVDPLEGTVSRVVLLTQTLRCAVIPASGGTLEAFDVRFMSDVADSTDVRFAICSALQSNGAPALFMPEPTDEATFDGRTWLVMGNTPLNVDGTPVIFSIGFRGP